MLGAFAAIALALIHQLEAGSRTLYCPEPQTHNPVYTVKMAPVQVKIDEFYLNECCGGNNCNFGMLLSSGKGQVNFGQADVSSHNREFSTDNEHTKLIVGHIFKGLQGNLLTFETNGHGQVVVTVNNNGAYLGSGGVQITTGAASGEQTVQTEAFSQNGCPVTVALAATCDFVGGGGGGPPATQQVPNTTPHFGPPGPPRPTQGQRTPGPPQPPFTQRPIMKPGPPVQDEYSYPCRNRGPNGPPNNPGGPGGNPCVNCKPNGPGGGPPNGPSGGPPNGPSGGPPNGPGGGPPNGPGGGPPNGAGGPKTGFGRNKRGRIPKKFRKARNPRGRGRKRSEAQRKRAYKKRQGITKRKKSRAPNRKRAPSSRRKRFSRHDLNNGNQHVGGHGGGPMSPGSESTNGANVCDINGDPRPQGPGPEPGSWPKPHPVPIPHPGPGPGPRPGPDPGPEPGPPINHCSWCPKKARRGRGNGMSKNKKSRGPGRKKHSRFGKGGKRPSKLRLKKGRKRNAKKYGRFKRAKKAFRKPNATRRKRAGKKAGARGPRQGPKSRRPGKQQLRRGVRTKRRG